MDTLPNALITEILLKLPVKSLITLKCVSKSLNSLISNHEFINIHLNHIKSCSDKKILIQETIMFKCIYLLDLSGAFESPILNCGSAFIKPKFYKLVGTCNGLICVRNQDMKDCYSIDFVVFNPCIRKQRNIFIC